MTIQTSNLFTSSNGSISLNAAIDLLKDSIQEIGGFSVSKNDSCISDEMETHFLLEGYKQCVSVGMYFNGKEVTLHVNEFDENQDVMFVLNSKSDFQRVHKFLEEISQGKHFNNFMAVRNAVQATVDLEEIKNAVIKAVKTFKASSHELAFVDDETVKQSILSSLVEPFK